MSDYPEKTYQYRHLKLLTQWLHSTLYVSVVIIAIIMAYFSFFAYFLKQMTIDPEKTLEKYRTFANFLEAMNNKENLALILLLIALTFLLANIILTFIWLYRANTNIRALGKRHLNFSPRATIIWWFIPFANLIAPYQIMAELWRHSLNMVKNKNYRRTGILLVWWFCFISSSFFDKASDRFIDSENIEDVITGCIIFSVGCIPFIISALTLIKITRTISDAQTQYHTQQAAA